MAWTDKPTDAQMNALFYWFKWEMPNAEASDALNWLEKNATRKQVSEEMGRIRELKMQHKLNREECFNSSIWAEYFNNKKVGKE